MILLDTSNRIIEETFIEKFTHPKDTEGKYEALDITFADFDGVKFHIITPTDERNLVQLSMSLRSANTWSQLKANGVDKVFNDFYGSFIVAPESSYDVTLQVDLAKPPEDIPKFARSLALMKRNALAAPFYKLFDSMSGDLVEIQYREDEAIYLKPETDRILVIFSVAFKYADDVVFAKVFLKEFEDARKSMTNVPAVNFSQKDPPKELAVVKNLRVGSNNGFVTFVLFPQHIKKRDPTIDSITEFRNYLHYHIKCSKAYMHTRMRNKVRNFLQVLNRSKQEPLTSEKKTITGKTFRRPDEPVNDAEDNI